ncbi:MAG: metallophosphoesterase [Myxococcales bacterium]|nr:metallophosphoesterase [Myxococcales bacterium]
MGDEKRLLVAMTPGEWSALHSARADVIDPRDIQEHLRPLSALQSAKQARTPAAQALLGQLPPGWTRSPALLELLFEHAETNGQLAAPVTQVDVSALLQAVTLEANRRWSYSDVVLYEGLSELQQIEIRCVARQQRSQDADALKRLAQVGLIERDPGAGVERSQHRIADPVIADHMPSPLRIHHVSDVHVGRKSASRANVTGAGVVAEKLGEAVGQGPVRESYSEHVAQCASRGCGPHLLIVSGDLVEIGAPDEYEQAKLWLTSVRESLQDHVALGLDEPRVLLVPGNHDVDWNQTRGHAGARKRHLPFATAMSSFPRPRVEEPPETRALEVVRYPEAGVEVVLLGSAEFGGELEDPALIKMLDDARELALAAAKKGDAENAQKYRDRLGRLDPGLVHNKDLSRLRGHPWRESVRIAVLHHPVSPMPSITDVGPYAGLLNAGAVKDAMIAAKIALVLHGHQHSAWFAEERWPDRSAHTLRIAAAPSLGSWAVSEKHGYNEILVYREGERYEVEVRRVLREGDTWRTIEPGMSFEPGGASG